MPQVKLTIPAKGLSGGKAKVQVEASGYAGEACIAGTHNLLKNLGTIVEEVPTDEMFKVPDTTVNANG